MRRLRRVILTKDILVYAIPIVSIIETVRGTRMSILVMQTEVQLLIFHFLIN